MRNFLFILLLFLLAGCEKIYFKDDPSNTSGNNFELFWRDFDRYYSQFGIRNYDWDSVYATVKPQSATMTEGQLFNIMSGVVLKLNDMHVSLYSDHSSVYWKGWGHGKYPSSKLINPTNYLESGSYQKTTVFDCSEFKNHNIGYISINTFSGTINGSSNSNDDRYSLIDTILDQFKNKDGIVIDVRWNGGGNSWNAETVAGRFADEKRIAGRHRSKIGPGKNDFSDWLNWYIEPKGNYQYTKPVVVLTSRLTSSAAEDFIMDMQVLPNVTIVGDTTGGGTGSPILRELPNGWTYRLSTSYAETADHKLVDSKGIVPDITVRTSVADSIFGVDRMIEKALEILKK